MSKKKSNKRPRTLNYGVNHRANKSGNKLSNLILRYKILQKRIAFEGETLWLQNAMRTLKVKMDKFKINLNKI